MNIKTNIRELKSTDLQQVKTIINENEMFPSELLDEMASGFLNKEAEEIWFVTETSDGKVEAVAYFAPEQMTVGTWNLLLIAVSKNLQGKGVGAELIKSVENHLKKQNARVLLVETSGTPPYQLTREFYPKCGYTEVAVIREFYDCGDDKVVFWKSLTDDT